MYVHAFAAGHQRCPQTPKLRHRPFIDSSSSVQKSQARCLVGSASGQEGDSFIQPIAPKKILILGGTGRVGSSTAASLLQLTPEHKVTLGGRSRANFDATIDRRPELKNTQFLALDIADAKALKEAAAAHDIVVHTAGPFQRRTDLTVLESCIAAGTPYMDVCDDMSHSQLTRSLHEKAKAAGVPCITTAGIYPGVSNVMAAHMISLARKEYDENLSFRIPKAGEGKEPLRLLYSYYTAGTGGVGPTILETSFLLAGSPTIAYKDGVQYTLPPVSERRTVDYGPGLGRKDVWLYNLPEVRSGFEVLRVPNVSARFGTSPAIWNWGMWLVARLAPKGFLEDPKKVRAFSDFVGPLVRATDALAGEAVGMRVEIALEGGQEAVGLFVHKYLSETVGSSTAAFAEAMLEGGTLPGAHLINARLV